MMKATTVATLFAIIGTTTSFNAQPNNYDYGRHSHPNTASYNSLRDMAAYPETFEQGGYGRNGGGGGGGQFDNGDWRTNAGYSQGPGGYRDMETNPYYDEGWSQSPRMSRGGGGGPESFRRHGGGGPMGMPPPPPHHRRSADGFDPFGAYSPAMGMSRSDRRMDQGDLFMNSDSMGMRSDRTMRGFTYDGRNRDYGGGGMMMDGRREYGMEPGMMFEDAEFGPPGGMMGGGMDDMNMGMMGGGGGGGSMGMGGGMGRMGP